MRAHAVRAVRAVRADRALGSIAVRLTLPMAVVEAFGEFA